MDDKRENIIYTKADIDNYLQGKMQPMAMHQIERAALQDEFLADAIEGYSNTAKDSTDKDLIDIEKMILGKKQQAKVVPIKTSKTRFWRIAAAIILFVSIGIAGILLINNEERKFVASNGKIDSKPIDETATKTDSIANENPISGGAKSKAKMNDGKSVSTQNILPNADIAPTQPNAETVTTPTQSQNIVSNKFSGPSASNASTGNYTSNTYIENKDLRLEQKQKDESTKMIARNVDKTNEKEAIAGASIIVLPPIKMQQDTSYAAIPVTTFASNKKAAKSLAYSLTKEDSLSVPVNGWAAFNEYIQQSNKPTLTYDTTFRPVKITNSKTFDDVVALEFFVGKDGNPEKIKVTKSVDEETDSRAVELLKNGPKWQAQNKKKKGKVAIKF